MIGKNNRFHGYNSLRHVYRNGKTVRSQLFAVKYIVNDRRTTYRAAVVVSRKVSKSAVVRNRIRRRVYEAVREQASKITRPFDIVITIFSDHVGSMPNLELRKSISDLFAQAGITDVQGSAKAVQRDIIKAQKPSRNARTEPEIVSGQAASMPSGRKRRNNV